MRIALLVVSLALTAHAQEAEDTDAPFEDYGPALPAESPVDLVDLEQDRDQELEEPDACTSQDTGIPCDDDPVDRAADRLEALRKHLEAQAEPEQGPREDIAEAATDLPEI